MKNIAIIILVVLLGFAGYMLYNYGKGNMNTNKDTVQITDTNKDAVKNVDALKDSNTKDVVAGGKDVAYYTDANGQTYTGFYSEPAGADASTPGVVMIHEWWGLNKEIKDMAVELSKQGYRVLAVDLYGVPATSDPAEAKKLTASKTPAQTTANMQSAVKYLRAQGSSKIASLGWCYGGGKSLELALSGEKLNATVLYYGTPLVTDPSVLAKLPAPVLGIFGDADTAIPVSQVQQFRAGLITNDIKNEIEIYPGVGHAFANPSGANYAPKPTADAWSKTLAFLKANLK